MFQGQCHSAFQLLEEESGSAGVLGEDDALPSGQAVFEALRSKHPDAQGLKQEALLLQDNLPPLPDQVIFECIDADLIHHAAKQRAPQALLDRMLMLGDACVAHLKRHLMVYVILFPSLPIVYVHSSSIPRS